MRLALVLTAAGTSERFASGKKKEYEPLQSLLFPEQRGGTVLSCSVEPFLFALTSNADYVLERLIVTLPEKRNDAVVAQEALCASPFVSSMLNILNLKPEFVDGGGTRRESVLRALEHLNRPKSMQMTCTAEREIELVLIHDAARPFASPSLIKNVLSLAVEKGAAAPGLPPVDTCKEIDPGTSRIVRHLERSRLSAVQTPQCFYFEKLLNAHRKACADGKNYTDDTEIWGAYAGDVYLCDGERKNAKITYKEDLPAAEVSSEKASEVFSRSLFRIGLGSDTHELVSGRPLRIGGVHIPFDKGEKAHSDGDVLLHAVADALLGAAASGDIGELFPPSDSAWKNADSAELLKTVWEKVRRQGWQLENLDCVVTIEQPKILPWRKKICETLAFILDCKTERIFVKAKTAEKLGDIGKGKAVSALCTCLLRKGTEA